MRATNGSWIFYAVVFDGSNVVLYFDGVDVATMPATGELLLGTESFSLAGDLNTGDPMNATDRLDASLDEAQLQNTPRSVEWIKLQHEAQRDLLMIYDPPETQ